MPTAGWKIRTAAAAARQTITRTTDEANLFIQCVAKSMEWYSCVYEVYSGPEGCATRQHNDTKSPKSDALDSCELPNGPMSQLL